MELAAGGGVVLFYLVVLLTAMAPTLHPLHIPRQLAARALITGLLSLVGCIAFATSITDLAESRKPRAVDTVIYALLAALYTVLASVAVVYYWKPWVLLYTLLGAAGAATAAVFASGLLGGRPS